MKIEAFPDKSHLFYGYYDSQKRWYPMDGIKIEGTFNVRRPSHKYPYSYLKHFYTKKFAQKIYEQNPQLYCALHNITKNNDPYKYMEIMGIKPKTKKWKEIVVDFVKAQF